MEDKTLIWKILDPKKVEGGYAIIRSSEATGEIVPVHRIAVGRKEALIAGALAMHEEEDDIRIYFPVYDVSHCTEEGFGSDTVLNMKTACLIAEFEAVDLYREQAEIHAALIRNHCSILWGHDEEEDEEEEEEEEEEDDRHCQARWS